MYGTNNGHKFSDFKEYYVGTVYARLLCILMKIATMSLHNNPTRCYYGPHSTGNKSEYSKGLHNLPKFAQLWRFKDIWAERQRRGPIRGCKGKKSYPGPKRASSLVMILDATAFKLLAYNQPILKPDLWALQRKALWFSKADMFGIL